MEEDKNTEVTKTEEIVDTPEVAETKEEKTFTQEDVNRLVSERLARENKKFQKELQDKLEEAEKLRKMNLEEKAKYEKEKLERENAELKAQLNRAGLEKEVSAMFTARDIPYDEFLVIGAVKDNAELTKDYVNSLISAIEKVADMKVSKMLEGKTPRTMASSKKTSVSKEDFGRMTYTERVELYNTNKDLYESLK